MLGRLRMAVEDSIKCYETIAKDVYSGMKVFGEDKFKARKLESALKMIY